MTQKFDKVKGDVDNFTEQAKATSDKVKKDMKTAQN
jgi:hypothetical protein